MIKNAGSSGWMCDFGEYLRFDSVLFSGEDAASYHNRFPDDWARLNDEAVRELGVENETVYFMRSAWITSPRYNNLYWLGDQLPTWDIHDGL